MGIVAPAIGVMGEPDLPKSCGQRIADTKLRVEWLGHKSDEPYPVPALGGGFMAMRHDTLKQAGAFDADMPQWGSEDLELCLRYWLLGFEVWVAPDVLVLHYFRDQNPYAVEWRSLTHNLLRVALLHLSEKRLARVLGALKSEPHFDAALAAAADSKLWQQRAHFAGRRVRDDDWYFREIQGQFSGVNCEWPKFHECSTQCQLHLPDLWPARNPGRGNLLVPSTGLHRQEGTNRPE